MGLSSRRDMKNFVTESLSVFPSPLVAPVTRNCLVIKLFKKLKEGESLKLSLIHMIVFLSLGEGF